MIRSIRAVAALVVVGLALCGCYTSRTLLLDPAAARQPIASGEFQSADGSARRLTALSDGWYSSQIRQTGGEWGPAGRVLANSLGHVGGRDVYVVAQYNEEVHRYVYVLAAVDHDRFSLASPDCAQHRDAALARVWGARRETGKDLADTCAFPSARALRAALKVYAARAMFEAPYLRH